MSEINCKVIEDMLPLYTDGVLSDESIELIEEHIKSCGSCMHQLEELRKNIVIPLEKDETVLKKIRRKFLKKKIIISLSSVAVALAAAAGILLFCTFHEIPLEYEEVKDHIIIENCGNGNYRMYLENLNTACLYGTSVNEVENKEKNCLDQDFIIGFSQNVWQKYFGIGKNKISKDLIMVLYDVENGQSTDPSTWEYNDDGEPEDPGIICRNVKLYYNSNLTLDGGYDFEGLPENPGELIWKRAD
ncbi:MAG: zf-HC2 domain-containing protein [Porcipelethomonas sp.]